MKNFKQKKVYFFGRGILLPALVLALMLAALFFGVHKFTEINTEQNRVLTEQSIKKAAIQCYANEGMYPADLEYLIDKYYVSVDYDRYNVVYDCFASNVMPNIKVFTNNGSDSGK